MIRKAKSEDLDSIREFISRDCARNYFIAIGLLKNEAVFKDIYIQEESNKMIAALFHRKSNNLQFCVYGDYDYKGFQSLIMSLEFDLLISPKSYCSKLEPVLKIEDKGALISYVDKRNYVRYDSKYAVKKLNTENLSEVVSIYKSIFSGYPKEKFMQAKLLSKRGRAIGIYRDKKLASVAQTEFEKRDSCLIVGVATLPSEQHKGYASSCMISLTEELLKEGKAVYLQYDNPDAGKIYERLGYKPIDQVYFYRDVRKAHSFKWDE